MKRVTYKHAMSFTSVSAVFVASSQFNPLYEFVNNDPRYADFIKTCNEWRMDKVTFKLTPTALPAA